jgi:hypothetical protein
VTYLPFILASPLWIACFAACWRIFEGTHPFSRVCRCLVLAFMCPLTALGLMLLVATGALTTSYPRR